MLPLHHGRIDKLLWGMEGYPGTPAQKSASNLCKMVRVKGVEPSRSFEHKLLRLAWLPTTPHPHKLAGKAGYDPAGVLLPPA